MTQPHHRWRETVPEPAAYRPPPGLTAADRAREQDDAAGGRDRRTVTLPGNQTATASVALRLLPRTRRIYAYLRWSDSGKTSERYIGEVTQPTRAENLASAWDQAHAQNMTREPRAQE